MFNSFLKCALDGTVVPVGSDPYVIHDQFGETWKVEESDWLFNLYAHSVQIKNDTENGVGFVPVLEPHFASDGKRIEAENVSKKKLLSLTTLTQKHFLVADFNSEFYQRSDQKLIWRRKLT